MRKLNFRKSGRKRQRERREDVASVDVDDRIYRKISQISICTLLINSGFPLTKRKWRREGRGSEENTMTLTMEGEVRTLRHVRELMLIKSRPRP